MLKEIKDFLNKLDLSDVRLLLAGIILFVLPLFYLFFVAGIGDNRAPTKTYTQSVSRQSAFNLTSPRSKLTAGKRAAKKSSFSVSPRAEKIDAELDRSWARIQKIPRRNNYPANLPKDTRLMLEAEDNDTLSLGNSLLDSCDFAEAEKVFRQAVKNSGTNEFIALHAYGGLMEVYQLTGDIVKFRQAFGNFVKVAQQLKRVYGPLADNIARAQQMFEQLAKADPAKIREQLTRHNLASKNKVDYDEFMKSLQDTSEWFPNNLPEPEPTLPDYLRRGYGG